MRLPCIRPVSERSGQTLGTALTSEHIELIRRFTHRVVLVFDPDTAGVGSAPEHGLVS